MRLLTSAILLFTIAFFVPLTAVYGHGQDEAPAETNVATTETHNETSLWFVFASFGLATVVTGGTWSVTRKQLKPMDYGIVLLMVTTGSIHIILGLQGDTLLLLNGAGYLGLVGLRFLPVLENPKHHRWLHGIILVYAIVTIVGYFVLHDGVDTIGGITKSAEVLLVLLAGANILQSRQIEASN